MLVWRCREWTAGKRRPSKAVVEPPHSMVWVCLLVRGQREPQRVSNREGCEQLSVQKHQEEVGVGRDVGINIRSPPTR